MKKKKKGVGRNGGIISRIYRPLYISLYVKEEEEEDTQHMSSICNIMYTLIHMREKAANREAKPSEMVRQMVNY